MIPKIIHYCWFGRNPKPKLAEKCFKSWKKYCPDYEIVEWNEDNYDISAAPLYVRQAYEAKKWAFVTDYVRLQVVFDNGGIYMDTDVELVKPLDSLLGHRAYFGFESDKLVNTGLGFGAEKGAPVLAEMMKIYDGLAFLREDGSYDNTPCPIRNTQVLEQFGLRPNASAQELAGEIQIFPREYLCPREYETGVMNRTANTVSIHWFGASWQTKDEQKANERYKRELRRERIKFRISRLPNRIGRAIFGEERYVRIRAWLKGQNRRK